MKNKTKIGYLLPFLLIFLTSCATTKPEYIITHIKVYPEDNLLLDCDPEKDLYLKGEHLNNENLLTYTKHLELTLKQCNDDKALLRKWKQQDVRTQTDK